MTNEGQSKLDSSHSNSSKTRNETSQVSKNETSMPRPSEEVDYVITSWHISQLSQSKHFSGDFKNKLDWMTDSRVVRDLYVGEKKQAWNHTTEITVLVQ